MKVQAHSSLEPPLQSGPSTFDESRFIMTFLIILGVTEILCSFRLVVEWKTGKEIKITQVIMIRILLYQMQKTTRPGH